jgi:hypothetical protein
LEAQLENTKKAYVKGTFLQANIREMEECAKAAHNGLEEDIDKEPLNVRTLLILIAAWLVALVGMCLMVRLMIPPNIGLRVD